MNKKMWLILGVVLVILTIGIVVFVKSSNGFKEVKTDDFVITYDSTWKKVKDKKGVTLKHKKTNSKISIQCKELDDNYLVFNVKYDIDPSKIIKDKKLNIFKKSDFYLYCQILYMV